MSTIEIEDVGPVTEFNYEMQGHGLHVLVGRRGSGKSTILRTLERVAGGDPAMPGKRDGAKNGKVTAFGRTLKISRTVREEGELQVDGLGDLDIAALHTPKFATPEVRDKNRIAALANLGGATAGVEEFVALVGEDDWNRLISPNVKATVDVCEMAGRVKRAIDAAARTVEKDAADADGAAEVLERMNDGIEIIPGVDVPALEKVAAEAMSERVALGMKSEAALKAKAAHDAAVEQFEKMEAVDVAAVKTENEAAVQNAQDDYDNEVAEQKPVAERVAALRAELQEVERQAVLLATRVSNASTMLTECRAHAEHQIREAEEQAWQREALRQAVAATAPEMVSQSEMDAAKVVEDAAAKVVEKAKLSIAASERARKAAEAREVSSSAKARAEKLRKAADRVMSVRTNSIGRIEGCPLSVKSDTDGNPRLYVGDVEFDRQSDGERWGVILPIAIQKAGLVVLTQAAFGEMPPSMRADIDAQAKAHECDVITAVSQDCDLKGMTYEEFKKIGAV